MTKPTQRFLLCLLALLCAAAPAVEAQGKKGKKGGGMGGMMGGLFGGFGTGGGKGKHGKGGAGGSSHVWKGIPPTAPKKEGPKASHPAPPTLSYPSPGAPIRTPLPDALGQEDGVAPTLYPPAADLLADPGVVHEDAFGGADQELLALSAAPGGYAAIFLDERRGGPRLFLARLDGEGELLGEQVPLTDEAGGGEESTPGLEPALAAGAGGAGTCAWLETAVRPQAALRFYGLERDGWSRVLSLGSASYREQLAAAEERAADPLALPDPEAEPLRTPRQPALAARGERIYVAWVEGPVVYLQTCKDGDGERIPVPLNLGLAPVSGPPRLALADGGGVLIAWQTEEAIAVSTAVERVFEDGVHLSKPQAATGGRGRLQGAFADPRGGFWLLVAEPPGLVLRHVAAQGGLDGGGDLPVALGEVSGGAAASWAGGIAVLSEHIAGRGSPETARRTLELGFFRRNGERLEDPPLRIEASPRVRGAFLAGEGELAERLLVAWNDDREANGDVYRALLARGPDGPALAPEAPWNDDRVSSHQLFPACASTGDRAVVAWEDERASDGQVFFRLLAADGAFAGPERPAAGPEPVRDRSMRRPAAVMNEDGRCLLAWAESAGRGQPFRLRAQPFDAAGEPLAPPFDVDPEATVSPDFPAAAVALGGNQGYVLAWVRAEEGPVARRVSLSGALLGDASALTDRGAPTAANPALLQLGPERLVCVWDESADEEGSTRVLNGRFLRPEGGLEGDLLRFDWSGAGGDLDPELAPADGGGFLLAWTGRDGPERDVLARFHDARGEPAGPPLAITPLAQGQGPCGVARLPCGGGWIVAFQDDLSGADHVLGRRIGADRTTLGDTVLLDPGTGPDGARRAPRVAPLGRGLVVCWAEHARQRGSDVGLRAFGPGFDLDRPAPSHGPAEGAPGPDPQASAEPARR